MRLCRLIVIFLAAAFASTVARAQCSPSSLASCPSPPFYDIHVAQINGAAPGTVSAFSVAPANGFSGTVATPSTTPELTLETTVTGVVKGVAGSLVAATAGADYLTPTGDGSRLTGITATQMDPSAQVGALFIGNGAGFTEGNIQAGANVTVTNGAGVVTISAAAAAPLSGVTSAIGGASLSAGDCSSGTVGVTGATTSSVVDASPTAYPGGGFYWHGYVSSAGVVTVEVCATTPGTPAALAYNVRVSQ
jgi:hypothetical protein